MWDAAHGRASGLAQRPRRELHSHDRRRDLGVVEEDLVKVAEPEEQDPVGVLVSRLLVLPHDRSGGDGHAAGNPVSCPAVACMTSMLRTSPATMSPGRSTIARFPLRMRPNGRWS